MTSCIYVILNVQNTKVYIGSSVHFKSRKWAHLTKLRACKHHSRHLQSAYTKHGEENFIFDIIEKCEPFKLIEREQFWIDTVKPEYNIQLKADSRLGVKASEETKAKLRKAHETRTVYAKGFKSSKEQIEKLIDRNRKRKGTKYNKKNRAWTCPDGQKCKCDDCRKRMNYASMLSKRRKREKDKPVFKVVE